jgi:hypothetical protein
MIRGWLLLAEKFTIWQKQDREHTREGAAWVGGNAARVAGASAEARVTNPYNAHFDLMNE